MPDVVAWMDECGVSLDFSLVFSGGGLALSANFSAPEASLMDRFYSALADHIGNCRPSNHNLNVPLRYFEDNFKEQYKLYQELAP